MCDSLRGAVCDGERAARHRANQFRKNISRSRISIASVATVNTARSIRCQPKITQFDREIFTIFVHSAWILCIFSIKISELVLLLLLFFLIIFFFCVCDKSNAQKILVYNQQCSRIVERPSKTSQKKNKNKKKQLANFFTVRIHLFLVNFKVWDEKWVKIGNFSEIRVYLHSLSIDFFLPHKKKYNWSLFQTGCVSE